MEEDWIITSLLDTDFYKFTMGQVVFRHFRNVPVKYAFENRTESIPLARLVAESELRRQLDHFRELRFHPSEIHYLRGTNEYGAQLFSEEYLAFLENLKIPAYELTREGDQFRLEFPGTWSEAIYWETPALAILTELTMRALLRRDYSEFERDTIFARGKLKLLEKIQLLKEHPEVTFSDFGTRRRFSREWQDYLVAALTRELPGQFIGTSNVLFAMKHGLLPVGTSGHEMYMGLSGILHGGNEEIRRSHSEVLKIWWQEYGPSFSIALTDNYGSDFFFRDMTAEQARNWKGMRQDSGDPIELGEKAIRFYERHGIDPREKLLIFSDGLDLPAILKIARHFRGRIRVSFGWGTNLTNDLGLSPTSIVIKLVESCGHGTVKLSDNLAKVIGRPSDVERFMKIFEYNNASKAPYRS